MCLKRFLAIASVLSCALNLGAQAQTPVAFIGGNIMYHWQSSGVFGGSPAYTWQRNGFEISDGAGTCHETSQALKVVQGIIASGKKPLIHLLVGADDATGSDDATSVSFVLQSFETCFATIISTAQSAKLKIVVGTNPYSILHDIDPYNQFIFAYCAAKGVPVIDYQTLLVRANNNFKGTEYWIPATSANAVPSITNKGYAIMNGAADRAIAQYVGGVTLKAGYLGNEYLEMTGNPPYIPGGGGNTVTPGTEMHWYAYGEYSDGYTDTIDNGNVLHEYGTWTSSNPEVLSIDPYGTAWALAPGTANIHFTTLSGATINEWVMYVDKTTEEFTVALHGWQHAQYTKERRLRIIAG